MTGLPINWVTLMVDPASDFRYTAGQSVQTVEAIEPEFCEKLNATGTSQCGACTPGIVMAARWLTDHTGALDKQSLRSFMSGNLCRCTGYDGVIAGVCSVLDIPGES